MGQTDRSDLELVEQLDEAMADMVTADSFDAAEWANARDNRSAELPSLVATLWRFQRMVRDWTPGGAVGLESPTISHSDENHSSAVLADTVPTAIGRYQIITKVGAGGMGAVFKARDPQLEREVAVKIPHFNMRTNTQAQQRFLREARSAAKVRHPHICPIYDVGEHNGLPYLVSAFVDGPSLGQKYAKNEAPLWKEAVGIAKQIAQALEALHAEGVLHRDLKPGNVLLDRDGNALLTDFGLARTLEDVSQLTIEGEPVGTPAFMSPEQARGENRNLDARTDLYSLGVLLYWMLTGRLPFPAKGWQVLHQIANETPPPPSQIRPDLDADLERIVLKLMAREPVDRFADAASVVAELDNWLDNSKTEKDGNHVPHKTRSKPIRRWLAWALPATALAGVGLIVMIFMLAKRVSEPKSQTAKKPHVPTKRSEANVPAALTGGFVVRVWDDVSKRGVPVEQKGALPVHNLDGVRLDVTMNRPAYLYIVWIDAAGESMPVYPWNPIKRETWETPRPKQEATAELHLPTNGADQGFIAWGESGLDTVVLMARSTPLPPDVDLQALIGNAGRSKFVDPAEVAWLELKKGQSGPAYPREPLNRGIKLGESKKLDDSIHQILNRLQNHFELLQAVRFARVAKERAK